MRRGKERTGGSARARARRSQKGISILFISIADPLHPALLRVLRITFSMCLKSRYICMHACMHAHVPLYWHLRILSTPCSRLSPGRGLVHKGEDGVWS